ncbi:MAG: hypothetical protein IPF93_13435 [Saprospiraceae bacterium]|nr:hypothetical protein [Saprospiraceae bacterium]
MESPVSGKVTITEIYDLFRLLFARASGAYELSSGKESNGQAGEAGS